MNFIDETAIEVIAGNGGAGASSFRREKFAPLGGPNGGDGGDGGSVYLVGDSQMNTLVHLRHHPVFKAQHGEKGGTNNCKGESGHDLYIPVPLGTLVKDSDTQETLGDITSQGQHLKVAQGGFHGLGNTRFKSSINRSPRKTTPGSKGEKRHLWLELKLLADVGLVGLPNAGKSTLIRAVSDARPKVADYPFTTLHPHLGMIRLDESHSFVMADLPGIIEGASEGVGLGIEFLKHVARTRLLLHIVDFSPTADVAPEIAIAQITKELEQFSGELAQKPRWLVFNKMDLIPDEKEQKKRLQWIIRKLHWKGPVFVVSAFQKKGLQSLIYAIGTALESPQTE